VDTRVALHGVKWPVSNPKSLRVDFSTEEDLQEHLEQDKQGGAAAGPGARTVTRVSPGPDGRLSRNSTTGDAAKRIIGEWERKRSPLRLDERRRSRSLDGDAGAKRRRLDEKVKFLRFHLAGSIGWNFVSGHRVHCL
jgi:hypothetical protein